MTEYKNFIDSYLDNILAVGVMIFCGAVVCLIIAIPYFFFRRAANRRKWLVSNGLCAVGTITALYRRTRHMRGDENTPSFTYEVDCARYSFETESGKSCSGSFCQHKKRFYQVGDKIDVYYRPDIPAENCTLRHIEEDKKTERLFIILFAVMTAVTFAAALIMALSL